MSDGSDADADVSDYERGRRSYFACAPATRTPSEGLISAKKCRSILELGKRGCVVQGDSLRRVSENVEDSDGTFGQRARV